MSWLILVVSLASGAAEQGSPPVLPENLDRIDPAVVEFEGAYVRSGG